MRYKPFLSPSSNTRSSSEFYGGGHCSASGFCVVVCQSICVCYTTKRVCIGFWFGLLRHLLVVTRVAPSKICLLVLWLRFVSGGGSSFHIFMIKWVSEKSGFDLGHLSFDPNLVS